MKRTEARAEARANLVGACYCHECMAGVRRVRPRTMGYEPTMTTNERIEAAAVDPSVRFVTCKKSEG